MEVAAELHADDSIEERVDTEVQQEVTAGDSFRVDVSFQQPVVLHERSLEDDPLPEETTPDVPVTYEVIEKGSQKGADLLVDSMGYSYNIKVCLLSKFIFSL
jgi:hypothetical protein